VIGGKFGSILKWSDIQQSFIPNVILAQLHNLAFKGQLPEQLKALVLQKFFPPPLQGLLLEC
jgi:hypothetical protein